MASAASAPAKRSPDVSRVVLSRVMQPLDASAQGNVHGGVILRLMDEAAGVVAARHCRARTVTAAIDSLSFLSPVYVGNFVSVTALLNWVGRSSMEAGVDVEAEARQRTRLVSQKTRPGVAG